MEIRPIVSAMLRNVTGPALIALQIAITLAIVTNSAFIIEQRMEKMNRPTGMDHENLIFARSYAFGAGYDHRATIREDLEALRAMPGVVAAAYIEGIPLSGGGSSSCFSAAPQEPNEPTACANIYSADEATGEAMGLKIVEGRWFRQDEIEFRPGERYLAKSTVITRAYADALFGEGEPAVGKLLHDELGWTSRIVGVVEHMLGAWVNWEDLEQIAFFSRINDPPGIRYVVRAQPGQKDRLIPEIEAKLQEINRDRVITSVVAHTDYIATSYSRDSAMVQMLLAVGVLLIAVTALGIVGLAAFNVNQRRKQIGTRRALGATRRDILRYFLVESLVIATLGILLGILLAFLVSWWLGTQFNLARLDWRFVPPVILGLVLISQLAVLGPARRASRISPALATRSV